MTDQTPATEAGRRLLADLDGIYECRDDIIAIEAEARVSLPMPHEPGESHRYDLRCSVCGERGLIRVTIDPETTP